MTKQALKKQGHEVFTWSAAEDHPVIVKVMSLLIRINNLQFLPQH
jgi:hypothetical protein